MEEEEEEEEEISGFEIPNCVEYWNSPLASSMICKPYPLLPVGVRAEEGIQTKLPVLGAPFTMQVRGTTLVEGPCRRTMETVLMPAVGWIRGGVLVSFLLREGRRGEGGGSID